LKSHNDISPKFTLDTDPESTVSTPERKDITMALDSFCRIVVELYSLKHPTTER